MTSTPYINETKQHKTKEFKIGISPKLLTNTQQTYYYELKIESDGPRVVKRLQTQILG